MLCNICHWNSSLAAIAVVFTFFQGTVIEEWDSDIIFYIVGKTLAGGGIFMSSDINGGSNVF